MLLILFKSRWSKSAYAGTRDLTIEYESTLKEDSKNIDYIVLWPPVRPQWPLLSGIFFVDNQVVWYMDSIENLTLITDMI